MINTFSGLASVSSSEHRLAGNYDLATESYLGGTVATGEAALRAAIVWRLYLWRWYIVIWTVQMILLTGSMQAMADQDGVRAAEKKKMIEILVDKLASHNPEPVRLEHGDKVVVAKGYSAQEQRRVLEAWEKLVTSGSDAFPQLIAHLDDTRYSYTAVSGAGTYYNRNVGWVCAEILAANINAYTPLARPEFTGAKPDFFPGEVYRRNPSAKGADLKQWFVESRHKSLWELQLEAARWALANERKRGTGEHERESFGKMIAGTEEELERTIYGLELFIKVLELTRTPISAPTKHLSGVMGVDKGIP